MRHIIFLIAMATLVASLSLVAPAHLSAQGAENMAREEAKSGAERQARAEIESLLSRLCPGRCELVDIEITVDEPRALGAVSPGFEGAAGTRFETDVRRIDATILMDSNLPENFQTSIPRMAQFRLQEIAPQIEITPELVPFPEPQLPPSPQDFPELPPQPQPMAQPGPEPQPTAEPAAEPAEPVPAEPVDVEDTASAESPLWQELLPWIAILMTLLILGALILVILRRLERLSEANNRASSAQTRPAQRNGEKPITMPDTQTLRRDLKQSRAILNRMLRTWILEAPQEVAVLIRLIGPDIIADLRRDPEIRPTLDQVSTHVAALDQRIDAEQADAIAEAARSRLDAQRVVDDGAELGPWEFLEGLSLAQVKSLLGRASRRERGFILTRLSPILRARYLETLNAKQRRALLLEASSSQALSKTESSELAGRLRRIADDFLDAGHQAAGQAAMLVELIGAMASSEQEDVLHDLRQNRPDVADSVLARIILESAIPHLPEEVLADAVHRVPVETLTTFLQGTDDAVAEHVLTGSPAAKRRALTTELSLDIPTTQADFLDARRSFSHTLLSTLRTNGYDAATFNARALGNTDAARTAPSEAAQ